MTQIISHHSALVYTMVVVSAADGEMSDAELQTIGDIVQSFPVFNDFNKDRLITTAQECAAILSEDGGLDAVLGLIKEAIPGKLQETAYAVAIDIASADESVTPEQLRMLEMLRDTLGIQRLYAGAIERASRARHMVL
jgi:tellurite resistance protein